MRPHITIDILLNAGERFKVPHPTYDLEAHSAVVHLFVQGRVLAFDEAVMVRCARRFKNGRTTQARIVVERELPDLPDFLRQEFSHYLGRLTP